MAVFDICEGLLLTLMDTFNISLEDLLHLSNAPPSTDDSDMNTTAGTPISKE